MRPYLFRMVVVVVAVGVDTFYNEAAAFAIVTATL